MIWTEIEQTSSKRRQRLWPAIVFKIIQIVRNNLKYTDVKQYLTLGTIDDLFLHLKLTEPYEVYGNDKRNLSII